MSKEDVDEGCDRLTEGRTDRFLYIYTAGYRNFIVCKQIMKKIDFQGRYGRENIIKTN